MALDDYLKKRRFSETPEPQGKYRSKPSVKKLRFVVQKHDATRLHYDFRLELDGVLKSWAVPKGPSLRPTDHHLAVQVEDHPLEYRHFEGTIPEGNYGAGEVIVWDEGTYTPRAETDNPSKAIRQGLAKGHLTFLLQGQKLKGEFALIQLHGKEEDAWLLVKKDDEYAEDRDVTLDTRSVKSARSLATTSEINLAGYSTVTKPWQVTPMLCTLTKQSFDASDWLFEIKWDGYRAIASTFKNQRALYSRKGQDFSVKFPPIFAALQDIKEDVILDGEIVVVDNEGRAHFEWLQQWPRQAEGDLLYYVFDILWYKHKDIRTMPLRQRKAFLKELLPSSPYIRYSDHIEEKGRALFDSVRNHAMEGVIAKNAASSYKEKTRSSDWLKIKTHQRQEVVIGGFTEPRGGRKYFGSLLVGVYDDGHYKYVGHSGGGLPDNQRKQLHEKLLRLQRITSPFITPPKPNAPVHWVTPRLVAEMTFSEWTQDGYMRQPQIVGLRSDKDPQEIRQEYSQSLDATKQTTANKIHFTHLDKVFFPEKQYTKGDIVTYYTKIAPYILPYLADRPLSLLRQPEGLKGQAFFQKNIEHLPEYLQSADIYSESHKGTLHWLIGGQLDALLYAVQLGSIEINPWNSRTPHLERPDWAVIDLDPEGVDFSAVIKVALTVKEVCDEWHIPTYPKTSGKTGLHIFIPMGAAYVYEQVKNFAHLIALEVNKRQPDITSVERMPKKRPHKVYLDYLQNRAGQTLAAPYSLRPTAEATVSTPLRWHEVRPGLDPKAFTIRTIGRRIGQIGDIWQPVLGKGVDLATVLENIRQ